MGTYTVPKTITDLSLEQLKIMYDDRLSPRRLACAGKKYDLLKCLWKESLLDDCYLEKYKGHNQDEISQYDDGFSRHLQASTPRQYTGENEYAKQRLADRIKPVPAEDPGRFEKRKRKIHDLIRSEIGAKWWDFGRKLGVKMGQLDAIETEQKQVSRRVDKIFEVFEEERCSEIAYVDRVRSALEDSRRRDLAIKVMEIMDR